MIITKRSILDVAAVLDPPLPVLVNYEFVTYYLDKANVCNDFFREQFRPITKDSSLLKNEIFETVTRLSDFNIDTDTIVKLRLSLGPNKACCCDGISIRMLSLCATAISKPLHTLFNNNVMNECFHKKSDT